jgi:hypothetical protein
MQLGQLIAIGLDQPHALCHVAVRIHVEQDCSSVAN